jgi:predicted membrane protein
MTLILESIENLTPIIGRWCLLITCSLMLVLMLREKWGKGQQKTQSNTSFVVDLFLILLILTSLTIVLIFLTQKY